jgi:type II secretion system protein I
MNARGFTLLEVLVALAILGVAVVASIQGFAQGLRLLKLSSDHQDAMLVADQKIREVTTPVEGREDGTETRFQWMRTITRLPMPEAERTGRQNRWGVFEIDVRVRWDEHREVQLSTLRTVALDASGRPVQPSTTGQPIAPGQLTPGQTTIPGQTTPGQILTPGRPPTPTSPLGR